MYYLSKLRFCTGTAVSPTAGGALLLRLDLGAVFSAGERVGGETVGLGREEQTLRRAGSWALT